jgi:hypothetical protein
MEPFTVIPRNAARSSLADLAAIASQYPVYRVEVR